MSPTGTSCCPRTGSARSFSAARSATTARSWKVATRATTRCTGLHTGRSTGRSTGPIASSAPPPDGRRVVLYAPTWRDDAAIREGRYQFDLRLDLAAAADALGGDHVLLLRLR